MLGRLKFDISQLVEQQLDKLPKEVWSSKTTTFFDPAMGGGQFVSSIERRLLEAGHSKENIRLRVSGYESNIMRVNFAVNKFNLIGRYTPKDALEETFTEKYDVVLNAPPFGDSKDSGGTLWGRYANLVFDNLVKPNGIIVGISPPSFIGKHLQEGTGKSDYTCFANNQIVELHLFDNFEKEKYFRGVGTKVCWYIALNKKPNELTNIVGYDKGKTFSYQTDFTEHTLIPQLVNETTISIHNKIINSSSMKFTQKRKLHYHYMKKKNQVSDTITKEHSYKSYFSHKITRYANFKFDDYDAIKVMIPQTSTIKNSFVDEKCNVSEDLFYICCKTFQEANNILEYLKSPLVTYIGKIYRPGRNLGALLDAEIIPVLDNKIQFTDEELEYIKNY